MNELLAYTITMVNGSLHFQGYSHYFDHAEGTWNFQGEDRETLIVAGSELCWINSKPVKWLGEQGAQAA